MKDLREGAEASANVLEDILGPLRDRLRVIQLPGYGVEEQFAIARSHLLPRLLTRFGIGDEVQLDEEAVAAVGLDYSSASGLRQVEQRLTAVVSRGLRQHLLRGRSVRVTSGMVQGWLPRGARSGLVGFHRSERQSSSSPRKSQP